MAKRQEMSNLYRLTYLWIVASMIWVEVANLCWEREQSDLARVAASQENSAIMADFLRFFEAEADLINGTNISRVADIYLTREGRVVSIDILSKKGSVPLVSMGDTALADEVVRKEVWAMKSAYGPPDFVVQLGIQSNVASHLRGLNSGYVVAWGGMAVFWVGVFFSMRWLRSRIVFLNQLVDSVLEQSGDQESSVEGNDVFAQIGRKVVAVTSIQQAAYAPPAAANDSGKSVANASPISSDSEAA